jgi:hypothetical protein
MGDVLSAIANGTRFDSCRRPGSFKYDWLGVCIFDVTTEEPAIGGQIIKAPLEHRKCSDRTVACVGPADLANGGPLTPARRRAAKGA